MTTNPLHRETPEGKDGKGRLHGASAVRRLLNATEVGPDWNHGLPVNFWDAADAVVEASDDETIRAALRNLLALHMFNLTEKHPVVAMRNINTGDIVELHGVARKVVEKHGDGQRGGNVQVQTVLQHAPGVETSGVFANDGDVRIPLLHRVSPEMGQRLFTEILDASVQTDETGTAYRLGLEKAFLMLTGEDPERLHDAIEEALQARHEEQIAAEELY